jgi:hypothetical protein
MSLGTAAKISGLVAAAWYVVFWIIWTVGVLNADADVVSGHPARAIVLGGLVYGTLSALIVFLAAFVWGLWAVLGFFVIRRLRELL